MDVYGRIEQLLKENNMKQSDLAKKTGISTGLISQWKNRSQQPSSKKLQVVADYFGVTVDYLLGNEIKPTAENGSELVNNDEELTEYLEELKNRPELRMMFQLAKGATKEDVEKAVEIIEAFLK